MRVVETIAELRAARAGLGDLGFVPTMGFLHEGHLQLMRRAKADGGALAASIFVNPAQFGPGEDLSRYPRDLQRDLKLLETEGVDLVFTPQPAEVYPSGFTSRVDVGPLAERLDGAARPGHFSGVATVVAKLFNMVQPQRAFFGQKDAQQVAVIRRMVGDLDVPVSLVVVPTVREPDGLALSSRNVYLAPEERRAAAVLSRALRIAQSRFSDGERDAAALRRLMAGVLAEEPLARPDYVAVADPTTFLEPDTAEPGAVALLAVRFGSTRLIDNAVLG